MTNSQLPFSNYPAWLSTGAIVAFLSWFGLAGTGEPTAPAKDKIEVAGDEGTNDIYPSVQGTQSLPASMWDDPFALANAPEVVKLKPDSDVRRLTETKLSEGPGEGKIMLLLVSVRGGNSAEDVRGRQRRRHAVELALANLGFSLSFPDRMTYRKKSYEFHFSPRPKKPEAAGDTPSDMQTVALPTKLYRHTSSNSFILVTWFQDTHLGAQPLNTIRQIMGDLVDHPSTLKDRAALCLLGPIWSGTLESIITDSKRSGPKDASFFQGWKHGTAICNSVCTANDQRIGLEPGQSHITIGGNQKVRLIHTIGSDDRLLEVLKHELEIRGVWPKRRNGNRMVLFAEESALSYVQDLRTKFETSFAEPVIIPYLKGIGCKDQTATASVEDYLSRSMKELTTLSSSRSIKPGAVRAVGIFGSQWEDKNLILRKARSVFPAATFFTTELDARYNSPDARPHTQNLIVASHYGLWIDGSGEAFRHVEHIPSFRDGYQTSAFMGMSILGTAFLDGRLKNESGNETFEFRDRGVSQDLYDLVGRRRTDPDERESYVFLQPSVFEIGSRSAIQLSNYSNRRAASHPLQQPVGAISVHRHIWLLGILVLAAVMTGLVFNFLARFSTDASALRKKIVNGVKATGSLFIQFATDKPRVKWGTAWPMALTVILGLIVLGAMIVSDSSDESEPISFTEGISIWPSICGLFLVIALGLREIRDLFPQYRVSRMSVHSRAAAKVTGTVVVGFYLISFLESGRIVSPARDWVVRGLADLMLFIATWLVVFATIRCLLYSLGARKAITTFRGDISQTPDSVEFLQTSQKAMQLSIESSRDLIGPAVLSVLFVAARWRGWDAWGLDRTWLVLLGSPIVTCLIAALVVRLTAIDYRRRALDELRARQHELLRRKVSRHPSQAERPDEAEILKKTVGHISELDQGPYGPITRDYLLGAAAMLAAAVIVGPTGMLNRVLLLFG